MARAATERSGEGTARLHVRLGGMHCSLCVESVHRTLMRLEGVRSVHVSIAHQEALVEYEPSRLGPRAIVESLEEIGYAVREPDEASVLAEEERELRDARSKALVGAALLAAASALMLVALLWQGPALPRTLAMGALALTTALGPARPIIARNGWNSLRRGILNQDVLVSASALGGLAGGLSGMVWPILPAGGFFGATVFVLAFHLIGGYLSVLVHVRSSQSVRRLLSLMPESAWRIGRDGGEEQVPVEELQVGDLVRVRPGERVPADGVVVEGVSTVDESLVTGEPFPVDKLPGSEVIGGSLNQMGSLVVRVTRVGADSFLRSVARQVAEARALKPGILRLVDRVLLVYVPAVFGASGLGLLLWTLGSWLLAGEPDLPRAAFATLGALIMGYPCALGMATPLAIVRASGEAAERGILFRSGEAFHVLYRVDVVALDKTGTLTVGRPQVVACHTLEGEEGDLLQLAASAELPSEHPLGRAIVRAARERRIDLATPDEFEALPGLGVRATVSGRQVLAGTERLLRGSGVGLGPLEPLLAQAQAAGQTAVAVAVDGRPAGVIALADQPKPDAGAVVQQLRQSGKMVVLLSGDSKGAATAVARALGLDQVWAGLLPGEKAALVRRLQAQGRRVAMVGDGINDAPALMQADVGVAVGAGADIAIEAADVVLVGDRLEALLEAMAIARKSYRLTVTNVMLALSFNGTGVLAAMSGLVEPVWAMLAMATSVSLVLTNSFRGRFLPLRRSGSAELPQASL